MFRKSSVLRTQFFLTENTKNSHKITSITTAKNLNFQGKTSAVFRIKRVQTKEKEVFFPICRNPANTQCEVKCDINAITGSAAVSYFQGNIFGLYQFWELFVAMSLIWISQSVTWCLQDSICFDLLGNCQFLSPTKTSQMNKVSPCCFTQISRLQIIKIKSSEILLFMTTDVPNCRTVLCKFRVDHKIRVQNCIH